MEITSSIKQAIEAGYKIICINTSSYYYTFEKLKKIYKDYFEYDNIDGLFHKGRETIKNTKIAYRAIDEYQKNSSEHPLIMINPEADINTNTFIEALKKFNFTKTCISKTLIILIDDQKVNIDNPVLKLAHCFNDNTLSVPEIKSIIGSKLNCLSPEDQAFCEAINYDDLKSLDKLCRMNETKTESYAYLFSSYKKSLTPKNDFISKMNQSGEIFGLDNLKSWITKRKPLFEGKHPIKVKGISLVGIPGTGKSLSSIMISQVLNVPLYRFNIHAILDSYVGNSEKNIVGALQYLTQIAPCAVLVDEIDKMFGHHNQNDSQTSKRVLGMLLTYMESSDKIFWVFTGNNIENIPPELLRKGRLDEYFYIDLPDNKCVVDYVKYRLSDFSKYNITWYDTIAFDIVNYASKAKMLICDLETIMNDLYLEALNNNQIINEESVKLVLKNSLSSYTRHKEEFDRILNWSNGNAKAAN